MMKITKIDTYVVAMPWKNWLFVEVHTDEGISGIGEATVNAFARTVETAVRELEDIIIGINKKYFNFYSIFNLILFTFNVCVSQLTFFFAYLCLLFCYINLYVYIFMFFFVY